MLKYTALITQSIDCASASSGEGSSTPSTSALCTPPVRPSPPSPSRETCRGVPVRPQLLSSAVLCCLLHRRVSRTPHPHTRARGMWVTEPNSTPRGRAVGGGGAPDQRRCSQRRKQPPPGTPCRHHHSEQGRPARAHAVGPGLNPHASTDRTRDTQVAEPRLPVPEDGRPGEGQGLTPDAPRNGGRPPPRGRPPTPPRHAAATGHAGQGNSVGPPHPHNRAHSTWVADPNSPPRGRAVGGGTAPDLRRPSQWWKAPPPGTPFRHPHSEQRQPTGAHAAGPVLGPHARTNRTRDTRVAEPWLPAPEDGRPGEGQRLTTGVPHNAGRLLPPGTAPPPPARHAAPTGHAGQGDSVGPPHPHTRAHSTWVADPDSPPSRRAVGGGIAPDLRHPSQWWKTPPLGTPFRHPHSEQRRPARAHAVGPVLGPHTRTDRTWDTRVAEPWLPAPEDGRPGEGQCLTPDAPHNNGRPSPPGTAPPPPPRHAASTGHAGQGDSVGPPHPHTRAHSTSVADPNSPPSGRALRGGTAPDLRRPSQWWKAPPPGDALPPPPQRATPARKGARCGAGAGSPGPQRPHLEHTGRGTLAARSRGPAAGGGTAPDTRRPTQRWQATPPGDGPPTTPTARSPHRACELRGQCWAPTPTHPCPQHVGGGPEQPAQWAGSRGRDSA